MCLRCMGWTALGPSHSENPGEAKMQLLRKKIAEVYCKLGIQDSKRIKLLTLDDVASSAERGVPCAQAYQGE